MIIVNRTDPRHRADPRATCGWPCQFMRLPCNFVGVFLQFQAGRSRAACASLSTAKEVPMHGARDRLRLHGGVYFGASGVFLPR